MICKTIVEGTTKVLVPIPAKDATFPPSAAPVFYNPEMELNRDINVAATAAFVEGFFPKKKIIRGKISYLHAFSASGIRGLRIAGEVGIHAILNDWSQEAFEMIKENIKINGLEEKTLVIQKTKMCCFQMKKNHISWILILLAHLLPSWMQLLHQYRICSRLRQQIQLPFVGPISIQESVNMLLFL